LSQRALERANIATCWRTGRMPGDSLIQRKPWACAGSIALVPPEPCAC